MYDSEHVNYNFYNTSACDVKYFLQKLKSAKQDLLNELPSVNFERKKFILIFPLESEETVDRLSKINTKFQKNEVF